MRLHSLFNFSMFGYLNRSFIFDQLVGAGGGMTIVFLASFEVSDFCTAFRESVPVAAGWAKANTINNKMVIDAIVIFFMIITALIKATLYRNYKYTIIFIKSKKN
jgi:hypothetical protein